MSLQFRLIIATTAAQAPALNTWWRNNIDREGGGDTFDVPLQHPADGRSKVRGYWAGCSLSTQQLRDVVHKLCNVASLTFPSGWNTKTRAEKKQWFVDNQAALNSAGIFAKITGTDEVWTNPEEILAQTGWRRKKGGRGKLLIQMAREELPSWVKDHIREMEATDFDGITLGVDYVDPVLGSVHLKEYLWRDYAISYDLLASSLADLRAIDWDNFTHNFLRINGSVPGTVGWFDSAGLANVAANFGTAAKLAFEGGLKGIFLDMEMYGASNLFTYSSQPQDKTFAEYRTQIRFVGAQIMTAIQASFPDIHLFMAFGYEQAAQSANADLTTKKYGLLPAFLDGLYDAATGKTKIINGMELSYGWKDVADWDYGRNKQKNPPHCQSAKYSQFSSIGFSTWLDFESDTGGWDEVDITNNYNSPEQFKTNLVNGLSRADRYMWVYSRTPKWWHSASNLAPQAYRNAIVDAHKLIEGE